MKRLSGKSDQELTTEHEAVVAGLTADLTALKAELAAQAAAHDEKLRTISASQGDAVAQDAAVALAGAVSEHEAVLAQTHEEWEARLARERRAHAAALAGVAAAAVSEDAPSAGSNVDGAASGRLDHTRLVLYSSDTPDKSDFASMLRCMSMEYDFKEVDATTLSGMLAEAMEAAKRTEEALAARPGDADVDRPRFSVGFRSIALACHGPPDEATGLRPGAAAAAAAAAAAGEGSDQVFEWKISEKVVIHDDKELLDEANEVRQLMMALGHAVDNGNSDRSDDGRVDLFACSLLGSAEGLEVFEAIERETKTNFAASTDLTGNPKDGGDWIMESDNVDVRDLYFWSTDLFDGTFATHVG
eukprot:SAG11_NODE_7946_length_1078_cov_11.547497_1_plen_358_part_11